MHSIFACFYLHKPVGELRSGLTAQFLHLSGGEYAARDLWVDLEEETTGNQPPGY